MKIPPLIGTLLGRLRASKDLKQIEVARAAGVDASRLSRIEQGEVLPTSNEVAGFLQALGSGTSARYKTLMEKPWKILDVPLPSNPDAEAIWMAEETVQTLDRLTELRSPPRQLLAEIRMHRSFASLLGEYLSRTDHDVAFLGDIGVGKSTAICYISGRLLIDGALPDDRTVLAVGGGRTTICEVQIRRGPGFGIVVEPYPDNEIYSFVGEFCAGLGDIDLSDDAECGPRGTSHEIAVALRNMANLPRTPPTRNRDGKTIRHDPAAEALRQRGETFRPWFTEQLRLAERSQREVWFEKSPGHEPLKWMRRAFKEINYGQNGAFSLPKRIDLILPHSPLDDPSFELGVIDTKGMDRTSLRPDLRVRLEDGRTLVVLCTSFNAAPDKSIQEFLRSAKETGLERALRERVILMVLPRSTEARSVKDDSGARAETDEDGYFLKKDHVEAALKKMGMPELPVLFFNSWGDDPTRLREALLDRIREVRSGHAKRVASVLQTVQRLAGDFESESQLAARRDALKRLNLFLQSHADLPPRTKSTHQETLGTVGLTHARTIWATTRRQGTWPNLDVYHHLGLAAAGDAHSRSEKTLQDLNALVDNMLADSDLGPVHELLGQLKSNASDWRERFIARARAAGEEVFRPDLQGSTLLWTRCEERWGQGTGYRTDIIRMLRDWFENGDERRLHDAVEQLVQDAWTTEFLEPLRNVTANEPKPV